MEEFKKASDKRQTHAESSKIRKAILGVIKFAIGILALVLFRWMPRTFDDLLVYLALFAVLIVLAIIVTPRNEGYWPEKPDDD